MSVADEFVAERDVEVSYQQQLHEMNVLVRKVVNQNEELRRALTVLVDFLKKEPPYTIDKLGRVFLKGQEVDGR